MRETVTTYRYLCTLFRVRDPEKGRQISFMEEKEMSLDITLCHQSCSPEKLLDKGRMQLRVDIFAKKKTVESINTLLFT